MIAEQFEKLLKIHREIEDSLSSTIKISHIEVDKLVVKDLINKRNSHNNNIVESFDNVLKYYLSDDEFIKYVINNENLD